MFYCLRKNGDPRRGTYYHAPWTTQKHNIQIVYFGTQYDTVLISYSYMSLRRVFPYRCFALLLVLLPCSNLVMAMQQPSPRPTPAVQAKPTVVEVTAESVPVSASPASVTVLTRSEIEESH